MESAQVTLNGISLPVLRPTNVVETCQLVKKARQENKALYPRGGGTYANLGNGPSRPGYAVDLRSLETIVDYPARDMTITVEAGLTLHRLQEILAKENQRIPVDVPRPEVATIGGALAANVSGPRRLGLGTFRDYLLGISIINDEGEVIKGGGRVVKNVAGYDLCKLYIGSLGTLGLISQVTFKVVPRPDQQALVWMCCPGEKLQGLLDTLHGTRTRPICIDILNQQAISWLQGKVEFNCPPNSWAMAVGFKGHADTVNWQVQQLIRGLKKEYCLEAVVGPMVEKYWDTLVELGYPGSGPFMAMVTVLPSRCGAICHALHQSFPFAEIKAQGGNGIILIKLPQDQIELQAPVVVRQCRALLAGFQERVVILQAPTEMKKALEVWDRPPLGVEMMHKIKAKLDPQGIFNPGRFVNGI